MGRPRRPALERPSLSAKSAPVPDRGQVSMERLYRQNVSFRLARRHIIVYEPRVARRREAPRREFFWRDGAAARRETRPERKTTRMTNPFEFIQQVRAEASKVVWPTRRETLVTTGLVLLLVVFASVFFVVVDQVLREFVSLALGFGRGG
jgi:preprotein translocase subunit SecE